MKRILVTGGAGFIGSHLCKRLLAQGNQVIGIDNLYTGRIENIKEIMEHPQFLFYRHNIIEPFHMDGLDEIYNLAAQSHVKVSFDSPEYTANADALGTLRLLEAIRILGLENKTKFYQASTSELYGLVRETPQKETTPFYPRSPYACAKLYAYWITVNYREAYNMFAANGILFNHESPRRGETFVTRKITRAAVRILLGLEEKLYLGNLSSKRDWGHARDYVEGMWRMLQQEKPEDFVLATGVTTTIRDFCLMAFKEAGIELEFRGEGLNEKGYDKKTGKALIEVDSRYFRPTEVDFLLGDATKAREKLHWQPKYDLEAIVSEMIHDDMKLAKKEKTLKENGYEVLNPQEP